MYILENSFKGQKESQLLRKRKKSKHNHIFDTKKEEEYNRENRNKYKTMTAVEFTSIILVISLNMTLDSKSNKGESNCRKEAMVSIRNSLYLVV